MQHFDIVDLYNRGLASFDALSPLERDVFVIHDLNLWYEMEGTFEDYLLGGSYTTQLNWLADTLHRIGDLESVAILSELLPLTWEQRDSVAILSERFTALWSPALGFLSIIFINMGRRSHGRSAAA